MSRLIRTAVVLSCAAALLGGSPDVAASPASLSKRVVFSSAQAPLDTSASKAELAFQPIILTRTNGPELAAAISKQGVLNSGAALNPERDLHDLHGVDKAAQANLFSRPLSDSVIATITYLAYVEEDRDHSNVFLPIYFLVRKSDWFILNIVLPCAETWKIESRKGDDPSLQFNEKHVYLVYEFDPDVKNHCLRFAEARDLKDNPKNSSEWKMPNLVGYNHMQEHLRDEMFNNENAFKTEKFKSVSTKIGRKELVSSLIEMGFVDLVRHQAWPMNSTTFPPDGSDGLPDWAVRNEADWW